jgi:RNA polymerase sigma-70 factor (ECF subfamily)
MEPTDDERIIALSRRGDQEAFGNLVEKYISLVGAVAYSIVGDFHTAGDVAQDVFLKVHRSMDTLRDHGRFKSWLYGIVRTTAFDYLRRSRLKTVSLGVVGEQAARPGGHEANLSDMERDETRKRILEAVGELPEHYRVIVLMKHFENLTYKEIADMVGATESAVESRLFRARKILKDKLKDLR